MSQAPFFDGVATTDTMTWILSWFICLRHICLMTSPWSTPPSDLPQVCLPSGFVESLLSPNLHTSSMLYLVASLWQAFDLLLPLSWSAQFEHIRPNGLIVVGLESSVASFPICTTLAHLARWPRHDGPSIFCYLLPNMHNSSTFGPNGLTMASLGSSTTSFLICTTRVHFVVKYMDNIICTIEK